MRDSKIAMTKAAMKIIWAKEFIDDVDSHIGGINLSKPELSDEEDKNQIENRRKKFHKMLERVEKIEKQLDLLLKDCLEIADLTKDDIDIR